MKAPPLRRTARIREPQMNEHRWFWLKSVFIRVHLWFLILVSSPAIFAQTQPAAASVGIDLPQKGTPAAVLFVRPDQAQSKLAIQQLKTKVDSNIQFVVVISGPEAADAIKSFETDWPSIADPDYALAGKLAVHVWPTLVVLDAQQAIVGHVGGVPNTFVRDADAYIAAATGKINGDELKQRLNSQQIVADSAKDKAARHVELAKRMLDDGKLDSARQQLQQAMELQPEDAVIQLLAAKAAIHASDPAAALALLDSIKPADLPAWQTNVVRLHALIALERWDDARSLLPQALNLNPDPSQAHYLAGRIHQHDGNLAEATKEFRLAYESAVRSK